MSHVDGLFNVFLPFTMLWVCGNKDVFKKIENKNHQ